MDNKEGIGMTIQKELEWTIEKEMEWKDKEKELETRLFWIQQNKDTYT